MSKMRYFVVSSLSLMCLVVSGCGGLGGNPGSPSGSFQLSVQAAGGGSGTVSSSPAGISCGQSCSASFASGTQVALTAAPAANSVRDRESLLLDLWSWDQDNIGVFGLHLPSFDLLMWELPLPLRELQRQRHVARLRVE